MKQIEITVRLDEDINNAIKKLEDQGFEKIRESNMEKGRNYTDDQIRALTEFQERFFESEIIR